VGQFESAYIDWVVTFFMIMAGINFTLHFRLLRGKGITLWKDTELKVYLGIVAGSTLLITWSLWSPEGVQVAGSAYPSFLDALRYGAFQAAAIVTTTGFGTADYEIWPPLAVAVLFILFFSGGMAGSTAGGIKVVRHVLLFKNSFKEIKQLIHPNALIHVRLNDRVVSQDITRNVLSFFVLYFVLIGGGTVVMAAMDLDLLSAFGVTISSVGNVGPAFGDFGPTENYASISSLGKWILSLLMMAGRLEIFTVMILFSPSFWKR
jgi:trk system potassium uptake protein TrkH